MCGQLLPCSSHDIKFRLRDVFSKVLERHLLKSSKTKTESFFGISTKFCLLISYDLFSLPLIRVIKSKKCTVCEILTKLIKMGSSFLSFIHRRTVDFLKDGPHRSLYMEFIFLIIIIDINIINRFTSF